MRIRMITTAGSPVKKEKRKKEERERIVNALKISILIETYINLKMKYGNQYYAYLKRRDTITDELAKTN